MGKPSFTVFVGTNRVFSDEDFARLPKELRRAYSLCDEWEPGEEVIVDGLEFESFDLGRDDTADPGGYVGFGVQIFGHWYDSGVSTFDTKDVESIKAVELVCQRVKALFDQCKLSADVGVF